MFSLTPMSFVRASIRRAMEPGPRRPRPTRLILFATCCKLIVDPIVLMSRPIHTGIICAAAIIIVGTA